MLGGLHDGDGGPAEVPHHLDAHAREVAFRRQRAEEPGEVWAGEARGQGRSGHLNKSVISVIICIDEK